MSAFRAGAKVHFIGIAGSGMNGIARILLARGFVVSGSDAKQSSMLQSLAALGATTFVGHRREQVLGVDYVVVSSAIPQSNPELQAAKELGLEVLGRAEALARLLPGRFSIAVAGTHGKTTTSGMFAQALTSMGRDPSFVVGSNVRALGESAREGKGEAFIVEADESDGSFLHYRPNGAIITNIELDHVDNFKDLDQLIRLFTDFVSTVKEFVIVCGDDPRASYLAIPKGVKRFSYGTGSECDLVVFDIDESGPGVSAKLRWSGVELGELRLAVPGRHNILNASAVVAAALAMGLDSSAILLALSEFAGTSRRFELKGMASEVTIVDDYGHHPTEIEATIATARSFQSAHAQEKALSSGVGRVGIVFQPHRFSRTAAFFDDFVSALCTAEHVFLLDIYSAGEEAIEGVTSRDLASRLENADFCADFEEAISKVKSWSRPGDLILTLGAGDVTNLGPMILKALEG